MPRDMTTIGPTKQAPVWTNDELGREHLIPGGAKALASAFNAPDAVIVDVGAAGAAGGATSVPVSPVLSGPIPDGTVIWFSANKFIKLNGAAAAGASSITTLAIPTALVDADVGVYPGIKAKSLPSGTVVGRTIAERDASTPYGPAVSTDDEVYITAFDVPDLNRVNDIELVRPRTVIKENFLPGWTGLAGALQTKVRTTYICIRGVE